MKDLNSKELTAYASAFASFIIPKIPEIREIILFGSTARGEAEKDSDIDLFINLEKSEEHVDKKIQEELKKFYKSKTAETFILKGIKNNLSVKSGRLEDWKLKRSIVSNGITLYGKYKETPETTKAFVFFSISPIKKIAKRNRIIRALFGRTEKKFSVQGMIDKFHGKKLSPSSFIIPMENSSEAINFLNKEKADYIFFELWTDSHISGK